MYKYLETTIKHSDTRKICFGLSIQIQMLIHACLREQDKDCSRYCKSFFKAVINPNEINTLLLFNEEDL